MGDVIQADTFQVKLLSSAQEVNAGFWKQALGPYAEGADYLQACEAAMAREASCPFRPLYLLVEEGRRPLAVVPLFFHDYQLDTALQDRGRFLVQPLLRLLQKAIAFRVLCAGSPYADDCPIGFAPGLDAAKRQQIWAVVAQQLPVLARTVKANITAVKDIAPLHRQESATAWEKAGFADLPSLPIASLKVPDTEQAYLKQLSSATRKDIRRKLKKASGVRLEERVDIHGLEDQIYSLYEETRHSSGLDYGDLETLPRHYFGEIARVMGERCRYMLYWLGDELVAFNLLLIQQDCVIDKFFGMRYPLGREHNIYIISWMENLRLCQRLGCTTLQSGQTAYAAKLRMGSTLEARSLFFRHDNWLVQQLLCALRPWLRLDTSEAALTRS